MVDYGGKVNYGNYVSMLLCIKLNIAYRNPSWMWVIWAKVDGSVSVELCVNLIRAGLCLE